MQWVEVPKRTVFRHPFRANKGQRIVWNFSTLKRDIGFGVSLRIQPDTDAKGLREVVPITRYESHKMTIKGSLLAEETGTYVLLFDNSFSKMTPKKLTFFVDVKSDTENDERPDITGWLLKKKKQKGIKRAWSKRWFTMSKGILQYFKNPNSYCRATVDVSSATVAVIIKSRMINIDNGNVLLHLKAMKQQDFSAWVEELRKYQQIQTSRADPEGEDGEEDTETEQVLNHQTAKARLEKARKDLEQVQLLAKPLFAEGTKVSTSTSSTDLYTLANTSPPPQRAGTIRQKLKTMSKKTLSEFPELPQMMNLLMDVLEDLTYVSEAFQQEEAQLARSGAEEGWTTVPKPMPSGPQKHRGVLKVRRSHQRNNSANSFISIVSNRSKESEVFYDAHTDIVVNSEGETSDEGEILEDDDSDDEAIQEDENEEVRILERRSSSQTMIARRKTLPAPAISSDLNLFNLLKKNVGKDLSKISMPVSLNEPLNILQRLCEELEYSDLLRTALGSENSIDRLLYVCAFAVSGYASTQHRPARKPFNPLLGETYECIRPDRNFRFISEKVSHHPPVVACHCSGDGFEFWQDQKPKSKFWGKSMEVISEGVLHLQLKKHGDHFTWNKVNTCMRNIFSESKYLEHYGELLIENHTTGERAKLTFRESTYFSSGNNEVVGQVYDASGNRVYQLSGKWTESLICEVEKDKFTYLWKANPPVPNYFEQYGFTQFAIELNELFEEDKKVLPRTDTRFRPDQRLLEHGDTERAEVEKVRLEEKQRAARKAMEERGEVWTPRWFRLDENGSYVYKGGYWEAREARSFPPVDLFS